MNLKDLIKNEKMRTAEDQNSLFMRMASKVRCRVYGFLIKHFSIRNIKEGVRPQCSRYVGFSLGVLNVLNNNQVCCKMVLINVLKVMETCRYAGNVGRSVPS